ncbi:hypothetical protein [Klebsiella oxytoca]|uniref:hypothetical protein n=1 Tax=Klebsiella oxytoca TaxID=571 RepID=UPI001D0DF1A4|nr:hypothetical protein [Klebsiella oxytoca]
MDFITIFHSYHYAYLYAGIHFADKGEAMARRKNMKVVVPSILTIIMGNVLVNTTMAAETNVLQAAPAYTATQTKGESLWSNDGLC